MKYCRQCGNQVPDDTRFCGHCGYKFEQTQQPQEPINPSFIEHPPHVAEKQKTFQSPEPYPNNYQSNKNTNIENNFIGRQWEKFRNTSNKNKLIIVVVLLIILCCSCSMVLSVINKTGQALGVISTNTPFYTKTPAPTNTEGPTSTPKPTNTARPTHTPLPTNTTEATPSPVVLKGTGDSVVDFIFPDVPAIAHIISTSPGGNFAVWSKGDSEDLLVNTIGAYDGILPINLQQGEQVKRFKVNATGEWSITISHISSSRKLKVPGSINGNGDDVFILNGEVPDIATISCSQSSGNFAVWSYGNQSDLLVNTIGAYDGKVELSQDTVLIKIKAEGPWKVDISNK